MFLVMERADGDDHAEPVSLHVNRASAIAYIGDQVRESRLTTMILPFDPDDSITWSRDAWDSFTILEMPLKD